MPNKKLATKCEHRDQKNRGLGLCGSCYNRQRTLKKYPKAKLRKRPAIERFFEKVVYADNGCWLWQGARKSARQGGYPMFHPGESFFKPSEHNSPLHAVAYAYEAVLGRKRPRRGSGKELSHTCSTKSRCVNPHHVIEESHKENMLRIADQLSIQLVKARKNVVYKHRIPTCHPLAKHYGRGLCVSCWRQAQHKRRKASGCYKAYYAAHRVQQLARNKAYRLAHQDEINARARARRVADPEKERTYYKAYRARKKAAAQQLLEKEAA